MRALHRSGVVISLVLTLISHTPEATACSCAPTPPPCQAYSWAKVVFLGTVTEVLAERDGWVRRARVRVDKKYKGLVDDTVVLFDDGMCDGPVLKLGEQYLWYTGSYTGKADEFPSRGCTRSRHVQYAAEDLAFLEGLSQAAPTGSVFGKILVRTDQYYGKEQPAVGAAVTITGPSGTFSATTGYDGQYSFHNLQPGKYNIQAELAGHRPLDGIDDWLSGPVVERGCEVGNVILRRTWTGRIGGQLMRSNGSPAGAEIKLNLLGILEPEGKRQRSYITGRTVTDGNGRYVFNAVAPGKYRIVLNLYSFPTSRSPYPTIYWPSGRKEADGLVIEVTEKPVEAQYDFQLPAEPASETVEGLVLLADGKPASGVTVNVRTGNQSIGRDDDTKPKTSADGRFRFQAFAGYDYDLSAVVTDNTGRSMHSATYRAVVPMNGRSLVLVVDRPGRFDNDPAERPRTSQQPR